MRSCPGEFLAFLPIRLPDPGHAAGGVSVVFLRWVEPGREFICRVPLKLRGYSDFNTAYSQKTLRTYGHNPGKMSQGEDDFGFDGSIPGIGSVPTKVVPSAWALLYAR